MAEAVTIPKSLFEYSATYSRPIIALWIDRAKFVQAVFDALEPWDVKPADLEARNEGKAEDQGFQMRVPKLRANFFFGPVKCTFSVVDADWSEAEDILAALEAAISALLSTSASSIESQWVGLALHLQFKSKMFVDVISPFFPTTLLGFRAEPPKTGAVVIKWDTARLTIDGSGSVANALFLRIERDFEANVPRNEIANALRVDELKAMSLIDVVEEGR